MAMKMNEDAGPSYGFFGTVNSRVQHIFDRLTPHIAPRWIVCFLLFLVYFIRVFNLKGWYIVTYGLGIYLLNQLIGFISPQFDPEEDDLALPVAQSEEFRPFARRLPEFKFWLSCTRAIVTAFMMTFSSAFDIPVFWPVLVLYFCVLFYITMKRQISHMIKHKYVPWSFGKAKYSGKAPAKSSK